MKQTRHHYETLGVHRGSSADEIKAAWKRLASELHPDRRGGTKEANDEFARLSGAYAVLGDPKRLKQYDLALSVASACCLGCGGVGYTAKQKGFGQRICAACDLCGGSGWAQKELTTKGKRK